MSHMDVMNTAQGRDVRSIGARFLDRVAKVDWRRNLRESGEELAATGTADYLLRAIQRNPVPHTTAGLALFAAEIAIPVVAHLAVKAGEVIVPMLADGAMVLAEAGIQEVGKGAQAVRTRLGEFLNRPGNGGGTCMGADCPA